jgi:RNA polymerase sigma factor (sigma-70 family)
VPGTDRAAAASESAQPDRVTAAPDRELVSACLRGQQEAWEALVHRYKRLVFSIPLKYRLDREEAGDVFQAVCLELFKELPRLRNVDRVGSWLVTVAAHEAYRRRRDKERRLRQEVEGVEEELLHEIAPPASVARQAEREQAVREAIARLSQRCRELIRLLFYERPPRPYEEVARTLGLATGSIGFIRGRCLHKLEQALEQLGF